MKQKPEKPYVAVKIDREHYRMVLDAAKAGTRSIAHQLRLIFETYFNGGKP